MAYISPLTYAQDLMNHAVLGRSLLSPWLNLAVLLISGVLFVLPSVKMHQRAESWGTDLSTASVKTWVIIVAGGEEMRSLCRTS